MRASVTAARNQLRKPLERARLVGWCVAAAVLVLLFAASSASAAKRPPTVALHVTVNGSGTVRVPGHPAFICRASFPTSSHCRRTFYVRKGRRIVVRESPASGWKLWRWSGACHGSPASCSLRVKARRFGFVTASFVPPGDRLNPYPLGTRATLAGSWQMRVNSATINADAAVEAVTEHGNRINPPPPAGAQYTVVNVSMTYAGGGSGDLSNYLEGWLQAEGADDAAYGASNCTPPPVDLVGSDFFQVSSGQTETGNLCFEINSKDAKTLLLTGLGMSTTYPDQAVWFALRQ